MPNPFKTVIRDEDLEAEELALRPSAAEAASVLARLPRGGRPSYIDPELGMDAGAYDPPTEAVSASNASKLLAQLARSGAKIGASIGGRKADTSGLDAMEAQANQPLQLHADRLGRTRQLLSDFQAVRDAKERGQDARAVLAAKQQKEAAEAARKAAERGEDHQRSLDKETRDQRFRREENQLNRESQERAAAAAAGGKIAQEQRQAAVTGLDVTPGANPTPDDAKKMKDALITSEKMRGYITELRGLHGEYGAEIFGANATRMKQLEKAIQVEAKNIAALGALSGSDQQLMEDLAGLNTTSVLTKFGPDHTERALKGLESWVGNSVHANKKTLGYQDRPAAAPAPDIDLQTPAAPSPPPFPGAMRVRDPKTGRTGWWDGQGEPPGEVIDDG